LFGRRGTDHDREGMKTPICRAKRSKRRKWKGEWIN